MRNYFKCSLATTLRCFFSSCCVVAVTGTVFSPSAGAASPEGAATIAKRKFCVIIRPASSGKMPIESRPLLQDDRTSSAHDDNPLVSFFKGQVRKIGFGVPQSFSVTQVIPARIPERAPSARGHRSPAAARARMPRRGCGSGRG